MLNMRTELNKHIANGVKNVVIRDIMTIIVFCLFLNSDSRNV